MLVSFFPWLSASLLHVPVRQSFTWVERDFWLPSHWDLLLGLCSLIDNSQFTWNSMSRFVIVKSLAVVDILKKHLTFGPLRITIICENHQEVTGVYQIVSINILGSSVFPLKSIPQRVCFSSNELVSLSYLWRNSLNVAAWTFKCFWVGPWIDRVGGPLGLRSPQCSWLDLVWFPSSTNLTLE